MSPSSPSSRAALLAALLLCAGAAAAEARLEIGGSVAATSEAAIDIRVDLKNQGPDAVDEVKVAGTLFGQASEARLDGSLAVGASRGVTLRFPMDDATPGVHAVALMLDYRAAGATTFSQPAWVLVALGGQSEPAVKLDLPEARMDVTGRFEIGLESADGAAHRVRVGVTAPRALRAWPVDSVVDVPARGRVTAPVTLFRVDAPWNSRQGLLVVARDESGPLVRTTAAAGSAQVGADPAQLPRLRRTLIGIACLLLAAAVAAELRRRGSAPAAA